MATYKILHAITTLDRGGAEIQLLEVLSRLDPERYEIHLAYLKGEGTLRPEFESAGVTVQPFRMFSPLDPLLIRRLTRYMRENRFDLVHTHLFKADVHATLAARKAKVPHVVCGKHNEDPYLERWIPGRVGRRISRKVDRTVDSASSCSAPSALAGRLFGGIAAHCGGGHQRRRQTQSPDTDVCAAASLRSRPPSEKGALVCVAWSL